MSKILALDFGTKRTGIAVTDDLQIIASGLCTVKTNVLMDFLKKYTSENTIAFFVVGLPKQMNNEESENEFFIKNFLEKLKKNFANIPVKRQDERFSSKMAFQTMLESGISKQKRKNKSLVDKISATIILQSYLEKINFKNTIL